jgi:transposase InsO family protein
VCKLFLKSTIGRTISDLKIKKLISDHLDSKLTFKASTGKFYHKKFTTRKKLTRGSYNPSRPGDLVQADSVTIFLNNIKRYIITAIDLKSGFAFAYAYYRSLSSESAADFMKKFQKVAPFDIKRVQTDNGSEFEKCFKDYVEKENITHFYNYPKRPKDNSFIERFNRTIQEQHVRWHKDDLYDIDYFNCGLMDYLLWYNTEKPHRSLNKEPPLRYYLNNFIGVQKSNMLWTLTSSRPMVLNVLNYR